MLYNICIEFSEAFVRAVIFFQRRKRSKWILKKSKIKSSMKVCLFSETYDIRGIVYPHSCVLLSLYIERVSCKIKWLMLI